MFTAWKQCKNVVVLLVCGLYHFADTVRPYDNSFYGTFMQYAFFDREIMKLSKMDTVQFIRYFGYPCEAHEVVTKDHYILTMHHIPHGRKFSGHDPSLMNHSKPVVFLQHGMFAYSGDWFLSGPDKALGFILADAGFDVWVGNARGNKHSRDHLYMDPNIDYEFWNFSWHEMGYYDLPAMIDYVLNATGQSRLFYVGHSQGTTVNYVLLSERPEYNDKIIAMYSLSPVAFVTGLFGPMLKLATFFEKFISFGVDFLNIHELKHENPVFKYFFHKFCSTHFIKDLCIREIFSFTGPNAKQFNQTLLPIILANFPAGSSVKQLKHYGQEVRSGHFAQFDYGFVRNMLAYGDRYPPSYALSNIRAPIYLFCSSNDYISSLGDVKKLYWRLPEGNKHLWRVEDSKWNHADYVWGIQAKEMVYDKIIASMMTYM